MTQTEQIKKMKLDDLKPHPENPNMHPPRQIEALAGYTQVKYILRLFGDVEYSQNIYKELLEILIAGDPKQRSTVWLCCVTD